MSKILVVEDEPNIAAMYEFKFTHDGHKTEVARDGFEGLKKAETTNPDLILLDLRMPRMSGSEMLEKLRKTDWGSSIRVVIMTNISRDEAPKNLQFLNVDRYIVKAHHTPSEIVKIAEEILSPDAEQKDKTK